MFKAYKYRIYPDAQQTELINKTIGCTRFVYNTLLADCMKQYKETGKLRIKTPASLKEEYRWLKEVDSLALCNAQMNLNTAYSKFFKKQSQFPEFHSKKNSRQSYTTNNVGGQVRIEKGKLRLPKTGLIKTVFHRYCYGKIKSVTVSKTKTGKYYASILTEQERPRIIKSDVHNRSIGIDMSFHGDFAVYSDGTKANFPNYYLESLKKLAYLNRKFSKTKALSVNHEMARVRSARLYEKTANQLKDWQEKESLRLASNFDVVSVEDINMKNMAQMNHGRKVMNNGFGSFRTMLKRKTEEHLGTYVEVDKWFPSSQICSVCGFRNRITKDLSVINYTCPVCGTVHNRDVNASKNIKLYGDVIAASANLTPEKSACGGCCKTCTRTHCVLVEAGSVDAGEIAGFKKLQAPSFR